jgi:hypothetical protein
MVYSAGGVVGVTGIAPVATPLRALGSAIGDAGLGCARVDARFSAEATGGFAPEAPAFFPADGLVATDGAVTGLPEAAAITDLALVMAWSARSPAAS